ncbi:hypothetical protein VOLCADRAFT_94292 [Volvox carteri f. nagariensis]|uniref:Uncharacterized protein n=1 Tax=Volvox carteri f. nagariensis TaxID=3068 RepID=D8U441_VOLCA|nr:uncharacterized protein VOLCADRAFT_94292 [Volvox carteri f. nagariensis]EFJ45433.1 hypothetical protein VOLCADRAFT_94292 [Volvox carteri f. nagariensis]|eukprot:XP_002953460.1 hypothetical protein VOLCADRAFT_94292 [Volvox carteri f. nagariensis]
MNASRWTEPKFVGPQGAGLTPRKAFILVKNGNVQVQVLNCNAGASPRPVFRLAGADGGAAASPQATLACDADDPSDLVCLRTRKLRYGNTFSYSRTRHFQFHT